MVSDTPNLTQRQQKLCSVFFFLNVPPQQVVGDSGVKPCPIIDEDYQNFQPGRLNQLFFSRVRDFVSCLMFADDTVFTPHFY